MQEKEEEVAVPRLLPLLLASALLLASPAAQADRGPTSKERAQVAEVLELPPGCAKVRISTETKKPVWASVSWKPGGSVCEPLASDGVTVARKRHGEWRMVTAGSDFTCASLYKDVPEAVAMDLRLDCH